jgi:hypothetical protein
MAGLGQAWWSARLNAGVSRTEVAAQIMLNPVYREHVVDVVYGQPRGAASFPGSHLLERNPPRDLG